MSESSYSPWRTIWLEPRLTVRRQLDTNPEQWLGLLVTLWGVNRFLQQAGENNLGDDWPLADLLVCSLIVAPLIGALNLLFYGWLYSLVGKWLGGIGDAQRVRTAWAWGAAPKALLLIYWAGAATVWGREIFESDTPNLDEMQISARLLILTFVVGIQLWSFFLSCVTLGEAHAFSSWKAAATIILANLLVIVPLVLLLVGPTVIPALLTL